MYGRRAQRPAGGWRARWRRSTPDLQGRGSGLAVYEGDPLVLLPRLAAQTRARAVVWAAGLEPEERADDERLPGALPAHAQPVLVPSGNLLLDPAGPLTREGRPYTVFTPYWRRALGLLEDGGGAARERLEDGDGATAGQLAAAGGRDGPALPPAPAPPAQPGRTDITALVAATDRALGGRVLRRLEPGRGRRPPGPRGLRGRPPRHVRHGARRRRRARYVTPLAAPALGRDHGRAGVGGRHAAPRRGRPPARGGGRAGRP